MTDREYYISWIDSYISETKTYHNHKETSAWAVTAFYWTSIVVLSTQIPDDLAIGIRFLLLLLLFIVTMLVIWFVRLQLQLRIYSDIEIKKLMELKVILVSKKDKDDITKEIKEFETYTTDKEKIKELSKIDNYSKNTKKFKIYSIYILLFGWVTSIIIILTKK